MTRVTISAIRDHTRLRAVHVQKWLRLPDPPPDEDAEDPTTQTWMLNFLLEATADAADRYCQNAFGFSEYGYDGYHKRSPQEILSITMSVSDLYYTAYDPLTDTVPSLYPPEGSGDAVYGSGDPSGSGSPTDAAAITPTIPRQIDLWILKTIARHFENRVNGLTVSNVANLVSETYGNNGALDYGDLDPYQKYHGL